MIRKPSQGDRVWVTRGSSTRPALISHLGPPAGIYVSYTDTMNPVSASARPGQLERR